jgi:putative addiction module component (TIGR02574 family)
MPTVNEIEKLALELPETDRASLASALLNSLSPILDDEDEGMAEALRRDADLEANPPLGLTLEQLDQRIAQRRQ